MAPERQSELDCSGAAARKTKRLCCAGNLIGLLRWLAVAKHKTTVTSNQPSTPSDYGTMHTAGAEHVVERDDEIDVEQVSDYNITYQGRPTKEVWDWPMVSKNSAYTPPLPDLFRKSLEDDDKRRRKL